MPNTDPLLTIKEVAQVLQLNPLTIYDYIRKGKLRAARFGRYYRVDHRDLMQFISEQRVNP